MHGGKRSGSGKKAPPEGKAAKVCLSLPKRVVDVLDAKRGAVGRSAWIAGRILE